MTTEDQDVIDVIKERMKRDGWNFLKLSKDLSVSRTFLRRFLVEGFPPRRRQGRLTADQKDRKGNYIDQRYPRLLKKLKFSAREIPEMITLIAEIQKNGEDQDIVKGRPFLADQVWEMVVAYIPPIHHTGAELFLRCVISQRIPFPREEDRVREPCDEAALSLVLALLLLVQDNLALRLLTVKATAWLYTKDGLTHLALLSVR